MRVLLDANLPRGLAHHFHGHDVHSVHQRGWSDLDDGPLLDAADGDYAVLITLDQSLPFQQNLGGRTIAVVVLRARTSRIEDLVPLVPSLLAALTRALPGGVLHVGVEA